MCELALLRGSHHRLHQPVYQPLIALRFNILDKLHESRLMKHSSAPRAARSLRARRSNGMLIASTGRSFQDVPECVVLALISSTIGGGVRQQRGCQSWLELSYRQSSDTCASACKRPPGGVLAEGGGARKDTADPL